MIKRRSVGSVLAVLRWFTALHSTTTALAADAPGRTEIRIAGSDDL